MLVWCHGWRLLLVVTAVALALRLLLPTNADTSWLITACERLLDGQRLYVDVLEVNPPASVYLYLLPVWLARTIGLAPELIVNVCVLVAVAASVWLSGRILMQARALGDIDGLTLAGWVVAALTILPMRTFAEREHIAVIALLPFLAVLIVRAGGRTPDLASLVAAAIGAGLTIVIKPHFVLAVGAAILAAAYAARSWRQVLALENWIAGGLAAAYGVFVMAAFPEFVRDIVPLAQTVYVPTRMPLWKLTLRPGFLGFVAAARVLALWRPGALFSPPYSILMAAAAGFALCYFIQGKGWPYHSYPMVALALIALAAAGLDRRAAAPAASPIGAWGLRAILIAILGFSCAWNTVHRNMDAVIEPIRRAAQHPTMLAIASDFAIGHPLVRQLGGEWAGRVGSLWISAGVFQRLTEEKLPPEAAQRLRGYARRDRDMLAADIARGRPEIILVQRAMFDWLAWAQADPKLSVELKGYREIARVPVAPDETFVILRRAP